MLSVQTQPCVSILSSLALQPSYLHWRRLQVANYCESKRAFARSLISNILTSAFCGTMFSASRVACPCAHWLSSAFTNSQNLKIAAFRSYRPRCIVCLGSVCSSTRTGRGPSPTNTQSKWLCFRTNRCTRTGLTQVRQRSSARSDCCLWSWSGVRNSLVASSRAAVSKGFSHV